MPWTNAVARSESSSWWTLTDPVLPKGGIAVESDTGRTKLGDGRSAWSALDYVGSDDLVARVEALEGLTPLPGDELVLSGSIRVAEYVEPSPV